MHSTKEQNIETKKNQFGSELKNESVRNYYNTHVKKLDSDYTEDRWFSSPVAAFDHYQTKKSIAHALKNQKEADVLEIGPGDGVWTHMLFPFRKKLTLVDQSDEMIERAKKQLLEYSDISYYRSDFTDFDTLDRYDLIFASRCFEYFDDKDIAVRKMNELLRENGEVVLITKNARYVSKSNKTLHTGQLSKHEVINLFERFGFKVKRVYAATLRIKSKFVLARFLFRVLHTLHVMTNGWFTVPFLFDKVTESYVYVAEKRS